MSFLEIEVLGAEKLVEKFDKAPETFNRRMLDGMRRAMIKLQNYIKFQELSGQVLKNRTGHLRQSIHQNTSQEGDVTEGSVSTNLIYARSHEFGADIYPKKAKALVFSVLQLGPFQKGGEAYATIFAKHVHIPARPFMKPGYLANKVAIFKELQLAGRQAAADVKAL